MLSQLLCRHKKTAAPQYARNADGDFVLVRRCEKCGKDLTHPPRQSARLRALGLLDSRAIALASASR